ncbi:MAG TPA: isoprenylcysteine carboxylmethyltransferase family protein [Longimicrobiaceae bacterium]|jgi:protein-S-isoprenylcysteine O-methyltransferase Ste14|nr:isoprenylcysteine carboxylmethyltransferase family protein [Longimicrobiaceae bacterium]
MSEATRDHAGVFVPPPLFYAVPLVAGLLLQLRWPLADLPVAAARTLAVVFLIVAVAVFAPALGSFRRAHTSMIPVRPSTALVIAGPYRFTRNPMYVGLGALYLAVACWFGVTWALVLFPVGVLLVQRFAILPEERYLEAKFGDEYRSYKASVRRWI